MDTTRVDRWLWAVRLHKTRTASGAACRAGHVSVNGTRAKPATPVRPGDTVEARIAERQRIVEVVRVIETRVGAKVAVECYLDRSPPPEPFDPARLIEGVRDPGSGRPTKRDRRQLERLRGRGRG